MSVNIDVSFPGEVFPLSAPGNLSLVEAVAQCSAVGAQLATVGQLHLAWRAGLEQCKPGWLADGTMRYSVIKPRPECGSGEPGVHTDSSTNWTAIFSAYCYRGTYSIMYYVEIYCQKLVLSVCS